MTKYNVFRLGGDGWLELGEVQARSGEHAIRMQAASDYAQAGEPEAPELKWPANYMAVSVHGTTRKTVAPEATLKLSQG